MATEGRILTPADVAGGNPVRTVVQSTQANDEGAPSNKDAQVMVLTDPNTPANLGSVRSDGTLQVNLGASAGVAAQVSGNLTAAGASTLAGSGSTTGSVVIDVSAAGNASFHLLAAAFVGTVVFEQSFDPAGANGTWAPVKAIPEDQSAAPFASLAINTAVAYIRQFTTAMFGPKLFRVRCSVYTSGTLSVLGSAGPGWYEGSPALAPSDAAIGSVSITGSATPTVTGVAASATSTTLLAANALRRNATIQNDSTSAPLYVRLGAVAAAATSGNYTILLGPGAYYEVPANYTGEVRGIWSSATGFANVTELVA